MKTCCSRNLAALITPAVLLAAAQTSIAHDDSRTNEPPTVTIVASDASASESGPDTGEFRIERSSRSSDEPLTVFYAISGTASNGVDYRRISNSVTLDRWSDRARITIVPIADALAEGTETVVLTLIPSPVAGPTPYLIGSPSNAVVSIADNGSVVTNQPPEVQIIEPRDGDVFVAPADIMICADAKDDNGFSRDHDWFSWGDNGFVVSVKFFEGTNSLGVVTNEPFCFHWTNVAAGNYMLTAVATDNDGATARSDPVNIIVEAVIRRPVVNIFTRDNSAAEGTNGDTATFTVVRSDGTNSALEVFYAVSGTASNGVDYRTLPGVVVISVGSPSADIVVEPIDDTEPEDTETVVLTLQSPPCATYQPPSPDCYMVGSASRAVALICDNDKVPTNAPPPRITGSARVGDTFQFSFETEACFTYVVEFKNSLSDPLWTQLRTVDGNGATLLMTDPITVPSRFYRVKVQPK